MTPHPVPAAKLCYQGLLKCLIFIGLMTALTPVNAQSVIPNLGQDHRSLKINGGLRVMNDFYAHSGIDPRRDAYQFRVQAKLNLNLLGINAPFTFNFSDGNKNFKLPSYTFTGISPKYKFATLHVGDRSLFFSKYTLGNITFRGVGAEIEPGKFYVGGMYGRLKRAVAEDLDSRQNLDPAYKRMGYGVKLGYQGEQSKVHLILFGAEDDKNSIVDPITRPLAPNANLVTSIQGFQQFGKRINVNVEWAHSLFNNDTRAVPLAKEMGFAGTMGGLFTPNASFQAGNAFNSKFNYSGKNFGLNAGYERITRGFRTLGAIFFNNDLENITTGFTKSWHSGKFNLAVNGGIERTNLDEFVAEKTARVIGSANLSYTPSINWNYNAQYSNFQNSTKLRAVNSLELFVDSVFLAQVTQAASFTMNHMMGAKGDQGSITALLSYQNANSIIDDEISTELGSDFWFGSLMYRARQKEKFGWGASLSFNRSAFDNVVSTYITPSFLADRTFFQKKIKAYSRISSNFINQSTSSTVLLNIGLGAEYELNDDHTLNLSTNIIKQFGSKVELKGFFESYINVTYGYRFKKDLIQFSKDKNNQDAN